jgi:hypothetical protein
MAWNNPVPMTTGELFTASRYNTDQDNILILKTSIANDGKLASVDGVLTTPEIKGYKETQVHLSIASGIVSVDMALGTFFDVTVNANITGFTVTHIPAATKVGVFTMLFVANGSAFTQTWSINGVAVRFPLGIAPVLSTTNNKIDFIQFMTLNNGTDWYGFVGGQTF